MGKTISQDQCPSSDSVHSGSYGNHAQDVKSALFFGNPDFSISAHSKISQSTMQIPYAHSDTYFSGLFTAYGPHTLIQPQIMGASSARVPLPVDLSEDGPIYVNAKQYHGILRRRKTRARLEAQNKLVKSRKPYLHESRHRHALNRVRGSGGRFLSKKQPQQSDCPYPSSSQAQAQAQAQAQDSLHFNQIGNMLTADAREIKANKHDIPTEGTRIASADVIFPLAEGRFPSHMAVSMQGGSGNRHYASIVR